MYSTGGLVFKNKFEITEQTDIRVCQMCKNTNGAVGNMMNEDLFPEAEIPLEAQIKCVEREIEFRKRVYARRVSMGRMSEVFADQQVKLMGAVLKTLQELRNADL